MGYITTTALREFDFQNHLVSITEPHLELLIDIASARLDDIIGYKAEPSVETFNYNSCAILLNEIYVPKNIIDIYSVKDLGSDITVTFDSNIITSEVTNGIPEHYFTSYTVVNGLFGLDLQDNLIKHSLYLLTLDARDNYSNSSGPIFSSEMDISKVSADSRRPSYSEEALKNLQKYFLQVPYMWSNAHEHRGRTTDVRYK